MTYTTKPERFSLWSMLCYPWWSRSSRRLRMLVRLALVGLLLYGIEMALLSIDQMLGLSSPAIIRSLVSIFGAVFLGCHLFDRRAFGDLGIHVDHRWWLDFAFGALLGVMLTTIIFVIEWTMGWVTISQVISLGNAPSEVINTLVGLLGFFIAVGISEELLVRGYLITNLAEGLDVKRVNPRIAILLAWFISSFVFTLLHLNNPNVTLMSTLNIGFAGLFLGLAYVLSGSLALPMGLHITWNLFEGAVFGFPVSGIHFGPTSILTIVQHGPVTWTGGTFGPEAGLLGLLTYLMGAICIALWSMGMDGRIALHESLAEPPHVDQVSSSPAERLT